MVCYPILQDVIGANFFAPVPCSHLRLTVGLMFPRLFFVVLYLQFRLQNGERVLAVRRLTTLARSADGEPRRFMCQTHGGFHLIDILPTLSSGTREFNFQIGW